MNANELFRRCGIIVAVAAAAQLCPPNVILLLFRFWRIFLASLAPWCSASLRCRRRAVSAHLAYGQKNDAQTTGVAAGTGIRAEGGGEGGRICDD